MPDLKVKESTWSWTPNTIRGGSDLRCDFSDHDRNWGLEYGHLRHLQSRADGRNASNREQDRTPSVQLNNDEQNVLGRVAFYRYLGIPPEEWEIPIDLAPVDRAVDGRYFIRTIRTDGRHNLRVGEDEWVFAPDHWRYVLIEISKDSWSAILRGFMISSNIRAGIDEHKRNKGLTPGYNNTQQGIWYVYQGLLSPIPPPGHKLPGLE